jgi:hypothetical protein
LCFECHQKLEDFAAVQIAGLLQKATEKFANDLLWGLRSGGYARHDFVIVRHVISYKEIVSG